MGYGGWGGKYGTKGWGGYGGFGGKKIAVKKNIVSTGPMRGSFATYGRGAWY